MSDETTTQTPQGKTPEEIIKILTDCLLESDPDALLEKCPEILNPKQLWEASGEDMDTALRYGGNRPEVVEFLIQTNTEDFLYAEPKRLDPKTIDDLVESHPENCLEYIKEQMSETQIKRAAELDPNAAAQYAPEIFNDLDIENLVRKNPLLLISLHSRLTERVFQEIAFENPTFAWGSDVPRLNGEFLKKHLIGNFKENYGNVIFWKLSEDQVRFIYKEDPDFAVHELRRHLPRPLKDLIPNEKAVSPEKHEPNRQIQKLRTLAVLGCGILAGLLVSTCWHKEAHPENPPEKTPEVPEKAK